MKTKKLKGPKEIAKTWWIDPVADEEDLDSFTAFKEHPRQGPLQFQGRLIEVVPKSELTKLRKRVEVLEEALSFYGNPESWIIRDKHSWRKSSPKSHGDEETILTYQHPNRDWVGTVVVGGIRAREALAESAKIAGE